MSPLQSQSPPPPGRRGEAAGLDIMVAVPRDPDSELLFRELQRTRARVQHLWPVPDILDETGDVLFCEAVPELLSRIPWVPGAPASALVAVVGPGSDFESVLTAAPDAVLHRPFTTEAIRLSLSLAHAQFSYAARLREKIRKLDETARTIRSVERAKSLLMMTRQLGEDEAYHLIRSQAMVRRISITALATAIIDHGELLN